MFALLHSSTGLMFSATSSLACLGTGSRRCAASTCLHRDATGEGRCGQVDTDLSGRSVSRGGRFGKIHCGAPMLFLFLVPGTIGCISSRQPSTTGSGDPISTSWTIQVIDRVVNGGSSSWLGGIVAR